MASKLSIFNDGSESRAFVFGRQFGPVFIAITDCEDTAIDEWDDRHSTRVALDGSDDGFFADYHEQQQNETVEQWRSKAVDKAKECGDIRLTVEGTLAWADPYEWYIEFDSLEEAFAYAFVQPSPITKQEKSNG